MNQGFYSPYQFPWPPFNSSFEQRRQAEHKEWRNLWGKANWIGGAMLLMQVVAFVVSLVYLFILMVTGHLNADGTGSRFLVDEALMYVFYSPLMFIFVFGLMGRLSGQHIGQIISFRKPKAGVCIALILFCCAFIFIGNMLTNMTANIFGFFGLVPTLPDSLSPSSPLEFAAYLLYVSCIPALAEEFAFRGVTLGLLRPYGNGVAVLVSSMLFALMHGNFIQIPFAFALGIGLSYATIASGSIWPAIFVHFLNNAVSCCLDYFVPTSMPTALQNIIYLSYYVFLVLAGIIGIVLVCLMRKNRKIEEPVYQGCLSTAQRTGAIFASPTMIIAVLLYLVNAFTWLTTAA